MLTIAVTSQNRKSVTQHAGRCRKFWVFTLEDKRIREKHLLELDKQQSFHESSPHQPHPLDHVDVLITADMGEGLSARLARKGITAVLDGQSTTPDEAVNKYLADTEQG